jgi:serine/threonine-protein kinase
VLLELGRGGMGTVYLARLVGAGGFERLVAIKRSHAPSMGQELHRERFLREARLAASIHHANVVGIHQIGEDHDGPYLACDYVEGEALAGLIERGNSAQPVPTPIALRVVLDALAGLHAAHETQDNKGQRLGMLHRDVSIENLLVGRDGVTRLTDFGIAKSAVGPGLTEAGVIHGKLLYLTPEYLEGEAGARSDDTYAMGVTLWIALAGAFPYRALENAALIQEVLRKPIPSLAQAGVDAGPMLEAFLARAVSRKRNDRFQTAREMLDALEAVSSQETRAARHLDVAEFVERSVGAKLSARRAKIRQQTAVEPGERAGTEEPGTAGAAAVILNTQPEPIARPAGRAAWPRSRALIVGAVVALALAAIGLGSRLLSPRGAPVTPHPAAAASARPPNAERPRGPSADRKEPGQQPQIRVESLTDAATARPAPLTTPDAGEVRRKSRTGSARGGATPVAPVPGLDIATDNPYR